MEDLVPRSAFYVSHRTRLHYVEWGDPSAPPVILLHGGLDHCRSWDWVAGELARDWRVVAPDLRGHGDSAWSSDGNYTFANYVFDLAELIYQHDLAPVRLVGHSYGGNIAIRYAGLYPEKVSHLLAIEGLGPAPELLAKRSAISVAERLRGWIDKRRALSGRKTRSYQSVEAAVRRMREENPHLSAGQAEHLTFHGLRRNDDGSFGWKFDNAFRLTWVEDIANDQLHELWSAIACPTLLVYGALSWASNPAKDGRISHFRTARVALVESAGHWVHHDQFEVFMAMLRALLDET